jgi:hypothetical protein
VPRGALKLDGKTTRVVLGNGDWKDVTIIGCDALRCAVEGVGEGDAVREGA